MYVPLTRDEDQNWSNWTLLIPTISVGNVGQLTMDLFINETGADHVGYLHDDSILPMVGNHPLDCHNERTCVMTTAAQVYSHTESKRIFVQLRSPLVRGKKKQFVSRLMDWVKKAKFGRVLIVTSTHSYERTDSQLSGTQIRWLCSPKLKAEFGNEFTQKASWLVDLEARAQHDSTDPSDKFPQIFLPGGGFAKNLYTECVDADVPVGVFLIFCSEGNNSVDAIMLAGCSHPILIDADFTSSPSRHLSEDPQPKTKISTPSSWKYMFGNTFDQAIF